MPCFRRPGHYVLAEWCGKLIDFVTWYKNLKHAPNVSKLAVATMLKGRGQKGIQLPQVRKPSVAIEQSRLYHKLTCSNKSTTNNLQQQVNN